MKLDNEINLGSSRYTLLDALSQPEHIAALKGIRRGIERESLRVNGDGQLSQTAHPSALGSPLTHRQVTTDYAEAMLELITPADTDAEKTLDVLNDIHRQVYRHLGDELLWPLSMPCSVNSEEDIQLAQYGSSNTGRMKTLYRQGLKNRYGSMMQVIAGIHYNFSMPDNFWPVWQQIKGDQQPLKDFISDSYFGLIRNFLRLGWFVPYLFGASPAVSSSFLKNSRKSMPLKMLGQATHYLPKATSLRMSGLGYNAKEQDSLNVGYNSLGEFVDGLRQGTCQANTAFEKIGVKRAGEYRQLNTNTLQTESELYAPIRPKQITKDNETLSEALSSRGVQYVEVRSLDVNPYVETGIDLDQMHFLDVFLTHCLLSDSPPLSHHQQLRAQQNLDKVATNGRDLSLQLLDDQTSRSLQDWGYEIFSRLAETAELLDQAHQGQQHQAAVENQRKKLENPELTPSAQMLNDMKKQGLNVDELAMTLSKRHRRTLVGNGNLKTCDTNFAKEVAGSFQRQRTLEASDVLTFDEFLDQKSTASNAALEHPMGRNIFGVGWLPLRTSIFQSLRHTEMFCKSSVGSPLNTVQNVEF